MYKKGELKFGFVLDKSGLDYQHGLFAYVPYSGDKYIVGGRKEISDLISDLQKIKNDIVKGAVTK